MKLSSLSLEWLVAGRDDLDMHPKKFLVKSQTWYTQCSVWGTGFVWGGGVPELLGLEGMEGRFVHCFSPQLPPTDSRIRPDCRAMENGDLGKSYQWRCQENVGC